MENKNKEIAKSTGIELFFQAVQSGLKSTGGHLLESSSADVAKQIIGEVALESGVNIVPIVGNAISSYRVNKKIKNLEEFICLIANKLEFFTERLEVASQSDKEKYSELLDYAYDSVGSYGQKEKIKFLINGLETIVNTDEVSFDIAYLYINTLNRLSLLDISVIKMYSSPSPYFNADAENDSAEFKSYQDVLDKFNITMEQYNAVRSNLNILGLLEKKTDQTLEKDLSKLKKIKLEKIRINANDKFVVSKFGKDFYKYFLNKN